MNILFCNSPLDNKKTDPDFEVEFVAARENGFETHIFSYEDLKDADALLSTKRIKTAGVLQDIIYRGWMLKPKEYSLLYETLFRKNYKLINTPVEYQTCHYLPDSYRFISAKTPKTIWFRIENREPDYNQILPSIQSLGSSSLIVKDFVKSQKHYWKSACFIPSANDTENVKSVINRFIELQGADLNEGLVIREFVELNDLSIHSKSGMPLKQEYRLFFFKKQLLASYDYWEEGQYSDNEQLPLSSFKKIAETIESNFFTMDIAKRKNGEWIIIELGDGQVAGIPNTTDVNKFYENLKRLF